MSNGLLFAVSLIAARWLGPEDYGVVAAMLAIMVILTIPAFSLQVVVARQVAQEPEDDPASAVLRSRGRQALVLGLGATALACVLSPLIRDWLNLESIWPVVITAAVAAPLLVMTVLRGVLQGRRRYGALGASLALEGAARFVAAIVALAVGAGATGVTAAPTVGTLAGGIAAAIPLMALIRHQGDGRRPAVSAGVWATAAFFSGFAILTNTDLLVIKHASTASAAGEYAAAAFIGKIVLMLPIAVGTVLIPEVAARQARGAGTAGLLRQALALVGLSCGSVVAACYLQPSLVAAVTYGDRYPGANDLLGPYALAMLVLALASVTALYRIALGDDLVAWACLALAPIQAIAMWQFRDSPRAVIWTMAVTGLTLICVGMLPGNLRWRAWPPRATPRPRA